MSEPPIPPPITLVRAEIHDAADVLVKYWSGPVEALALNVPPGGRYVLIDPADVVFWPPTPAALLLEFPPEEPTS